MKIQLRSVKHELQDETHSSGVKILAAHRLELWSELRPILSYVFVERIFNVSNFIVSFSLSGSRRKTLDQKINAQARKLDERWSCW